MTGRIEALYRTPEPNQTIELGEQAVELTIGGKPVRQNAAIRLRLLPRPSLRIEFEAGDQEETPWLLSEDIGDELTLVESGTRFQAFAIETRGRRIILTPNSTPVRMATCEGTQLNRVLFHLFNFPEFFCLGARRLDLLLKDENGGGHRVGRVVLEADGWVIEIAGNLSTKGLIEALKESGGYAITHVGELRRRDSCFTPKQAEEIIACLHFFLSFACGRSVAPGLAVGFGEDGQGLWQEWGTGRLDPWAANPGSWFDRQHGEMLAQVFPGFYRLWKDSRWFKTIKTAVYWYLRSNRAGAGAGVDGGLILAQAALERLAWVYAVKVNGLLSGAGFDKLRASDKLRIILTSLGVPKQISPKLGVIARLAGELHWEDGPQAVTEVRNYLVHPSNKYEDKFSGVYGEAWSLAQWYLDLILLRLCDHNGDYGNRITQEWTGEVERVPWADQSKAS